MTPPFVSVVVPCRNEEAFIGACLDSVTNGTFGKDRLEVLVVDGMSDDGTRAIVQRHAEADRTIRLIDNAKRTAPAAMNVGIRAARGAVIVRLDAHCTYPPEYVARLLEWLEKSGADNVGGVCHSRPANASAKARAIAIGLSQPFGVGNSHFRIGAREPKWVDTVPFGCYRREVFDRIGLFDEDLVRNQDDEFNARLVRHGGRILLVPEITCEYFARPSLSTLWRMYYQYGYFKPLVARKVGGVWTVRQLVPAVFVAALVAGAAMAWPVAVLRIPYALMLATYAAADTAFALRAGASGGVACALWLMLVFPVLHLSYGIGFLKGVAAFILRNGSPGEREHSMAPSR